MHHYDRCLELLSTRFHDCHLQRVLHMERQSSLPGTTDWRNCIREECQEQEDSDGSLLSHVSELYHLLLLSIVHAIT